MKVRPDLEAIVHPLIKRSAAASHEKLGKQYDKRGQAYMREPVHGRILCPSSIYIDARTGLVAIVNDGVKTGFLLNVDRVRQYLLGSQSSTPARFS